MRKLIFGLLAASLAACATAQESRDPTATSSTGLAFWQNLVEIDKQLVWQREGGVSLLLEIDRAEVVTERLEALQADIRDVFRARNERDLIECEIPTLKDDHLSIRLKNPQVQMADALTRLRNLRADSHLPDQLAIEPVGEDVIAIRVLGSARSALVEAARSRAMETIWRRLDPNGASRMSLTPQEAGQIRLEIPGAVEIERIKALLLKRGHLTFNMADVSPSVVSEAQASGRTRPGWKLVDSIDSGAVLIRMIPELTGSDIISANRGFDQANRPAVNFGLSGAAKTKFYNLTRNNRDKFFAIVFDGTAMSVPRINEPIPGGNVQITGSFTMQEADDLAAIIGAGRPMAALSIVEEQIIAPSLED